MDECELGPTVDIGSVLGILTWKKAKGTNLSWFDWVSPTHIYMESESKMSKEGSPKSLWGKCDTNGERGMLS